MARRVVLKGDEEDSKPKTLNERFSKLPSDPIQTIQHRRQVENLEARRGKRANLLNERRKQANSDYPVANQNSQRGGIARRGGAVGGRGGRGGRGGGRGGGNAGREQDHHQQGGKRGGRGGKGGSNQGNKKSSFNKGQKPKKKLTQEDLDKDLAKLEEKRLRVLQKNNPEKFKSLLDAELDQMTKSAPAAAPAAAPASEAKVR